MKKQKTCSLDVFNIQYNADCKYLTINQTYLHVVCVVELCDQLMPTCRRQRLYTAAEPGRDLACGRSVQSGVAGWIRVPLPAPNEALR